MKKNIKSTPRRLSESTKMYIADMLHHELFTVQQLSTQLGISPRSVRYHAVPYSLRCQLKH